MKNEYDLVVVGGGMIGASLALALAHLPLSIAIVEAVPFDDSRQPSFDDRSIALSYGSSKILNTLGIWSALKSSAAPIQHIHVSDRGHIGMCRLHASDYHVPALGYVVENRDVGKIFYRALNEQSNIDVISPAKLLRIEQTEQHTRLELETPEGDLCLCCKLMVAADGSQSMSAKLLNMQQESFTYDQVAIIANIASSKPMHDWAFERFTEAGPLAFLPLTRNRISVVWTVSPERSNDLLALSEQDFLEQLQRAFGFRVGKLTRAGTRTCYPLVKQQLLRGFSDRVAFVGNALHTGHPVAGQGFNLGLRDIATLAEEIAKAIFNRSNDIGSHEVLESYWQTREKDINQTLGNTHLLARLFVNDDPLLTMSRSLSLKWLDVLAPVKSEFALHAMGQRNDLPLLARGVALTAERLMDE